jgi:hypothetical protein
MFCFKEIFEEQKLILECDEYKQYTMKRVFVNFGSNSNPISISTCKNNDVKLILGGFSQLIADGIQEITN